MRDSLSDSLSRRSFLQRLDAGTAAALVSRGTVRAVLPILLTACAGARFIAGQRVGDRVTIRRADLDAAGGALVDVTGLDLPIYVRRQSDGHLLAVSTRCMHRGCQVDVAADRLTCPCHGSEYAFDGRVLRGPTELPLVRYRVEGNDERITIHLEAPLPGGGAL